VVSLSNHEDGGRSASSPSHNRPSSPFSSPTPSPARGEGWDGGSAPRLSPTGPLSGIRVLDFTRVIAGPAGTQVLGFLGADVIKVESKGLGTGREPSAGYPEINRAKKSITLDVRSPEGKDLVFRLAEKSDVVINNFSAFVMDRLGLGYEEMTKAKKDIIYIRMPGFGREGPAKDWVAYGQMLQCFTGLVSVWKHPETEMTSALKGPVADYISSSSVTMASMAAIERRDRTGKGQIIDLNMLEALAAMFNPTYMDYLLNKRTPQPVGYRSARYAPHGAYPCRGDDAWCVIAVETEEEWKAFQ
jgi:benzylsuccinate CoA-transferase BbsF subunit